uniref:Uncharacterized protein MANES_01G027000 n=1 Tax=Rhizophora mucronata TaxID=61149 RepID=A0A2P2KRJ7_RHIMU
MPSMAQKGPTNPTGTRKPYGNFPRQPRNFDSTASRETIRKQRESLPIASGIPKQSIMFPPFFSYSFSCL